MVGGSEAKYQAMSMDDRFAWMRAHLTRRIAIGVSAIQVGGSCAFLCAPPSSPALSALCAPPPLAALLASV